MRESPPKLAHRPGRRALLVALAAAAGSAAAQPLPGSFENWRRLFGGPAAAADATERTRLLAEGEALLAAGEALAAQDVFQRAAMLMHAPDTECSIVRAQMQAGNYRQALAFCAHAALAHRGFTGGVALYAWLLHVGGQSVIAARLLADAMEGQPEDAALQLARAQLAAPWPRAQGPLLTAPLRAAPYGHGASPGESSRRVAGTATLLQGGRAALVPQATLAGASDVLLRNGLGETVPARVLHAFDGAGLVLLVLERPLPGAADATLAARVPFAGSPAAVVEFAVDGGGEASWPVLRQGFFGRLPAAGPRALGVTMPPGARGGPVFDRAGRLAGLALAAPDGSDALLAVADWPLEAGFPVAEALPGAAPAAIDAVYETALRLTLQVIVQTPG